MSDFEKDMDNTLGFLRAALESPSLSNYIARLRNDLFKFYVAITNEIIKDKDFNDSLGFLSIMDELIDKFVDMNKSHSRIKSIMHHEAFKLEKEE